MRPYRTHQPAGRVRSVHKGLHQPKCSVCQMLQFRAYSGVCVQEQRLADHAVLQGVAYRDVLAVLSQRCDIGRQLDIGIEVRERLPRREGAGDAQEHHERPRAAPQSCSGSTHLRGYPLKYIKLCKSSDLGHRSKSG